MKNRLVLLALFAGIGFPVSGVAGFFVAALPDDELAALANTCSSSSWRLGDKIASKCLVEPMKNRWVNIYNRSVSILNANLYLPCDETHEIFDATADRVSTELQQLIDKRWLWPDEQQVLADYANKEILARIKAGRAGRDLSCPPSRPAPQTPPPACAPASAETSPSSDGSTPGEAAPPPRATAPAAAPQAVTLAAVPAAPKAPARAVVSTAMQTYSGARVATSVISSCANRQAPRCDEKLLTCLKSCRSVADQNGCSAGCNEELLSCKGCGP